ncbi:hypothetical protein CPB85DRAFT_1377632 [Mucidula mucida]|nr:hypothetical protein CPB85DRAFT_1377632 [Mucidula mucida]
MAPNTTARSSFVCAACDKDFQRENNLRQHWMKTRDAACVAADKQSPQPFAGDIFGASSDYSEEDFPGLDKEHTSEPPSDSDSEENDAGDASTQPGWEPPRRTTMEEVPDEDDKMDVDIPPPRVSTPPPLQPPPAPQQVPDTADPAAKARLASVHVTHFGGKAGAPIPDTPVTPNAYLLYEAALRGGTDKPRPGKYGPFSSEMQWKIAEWAKLDGPSASSFTRLLSIHEVTERLDLSFKNTTQLNDIIDKKLPCLRPKFISEEIVIADRSFDHNEYLCFAPERHYADEDKTQRLYHDFHTGRWWWDTQKAVEEKTPGATIIPVILSSDKTQVTLFRNKTAYPVYLTIGNLPKDIRRKPSRMGQVLVAYIPTTKLEHIKNKESRRHSMCNLFHACMRRILIGLKEAGISGVVMRSGDGVARRCHPIFAAYVGDYPEQVLVTCTYTGESPVCECPPDALGEFPCMHNPRNFQAAVEALGSIGAPDWGTRCANANIKPVQHPFWEDLPYVDVFLLQGVVKHLIGWITEAVGADELDARVRRLPLNHAIRPFLKGISSLSRVSGMEHKQICSFLLSVIGDLPHTSAITYSLMRATRGIIDFTYLSRYPVHSVETLKELEACLTEFHNNKHVFLDLGIRDNFNIPKLHFLNHYVCAIKLYGTADNYNTEATKRLHIDFAKDAYRATNRKDKFKQMTKWLERREKIIAFGHYIKMTKRPSEKSVLLDTIESPSGYGATLFTVALARFIVQFRNPTLPHAHVDEAAHNIVLPFRRLPVFHHIKFVNTTFFGSETLDSIHASPRTIGKTGKVTRLSRFDTAMIRVRPAAIGSTRKFDGLRVGRVRVVFSIPPRGLETLFPINMQPPEHLAYVEWFSTFAAHPEAASGMYRLKRQLAGDGSPLVSVLPVSVIQSSVHLFPKWGQTVPVDWTNENILDRSSAFLLSNYKDQRTFFEYH